MAKTYLALTIGLLAFGVGLFNFQDLGLWTVGRYESERSEGYFTVIGPDGEVLDKTARYVYAGDELIAENNYRYRIKRITGDVAQCELVGYEEQLTPSLAAANTPVGGQSRKLVAIYHTHSDESYVPTDGSESIPADGGIIKVGDVLAQTLMSQGIKVAHDTRPHEPHDSDAYRRSRRTAFQLLTQGPSALIDVHRDGVPDAEFYRTNIRGQAATKIRLVVGRQNQNMEANLAFAKQIKAYMDERYPGLIRGIFLGQGSYNQDLSPRSILIEVGTYTNSRDRAQTGAAFFGEALAAVLGAGPATTRALPQLQSAQSRSDWGSVIAIIAALIVGSLAFLLVSTGSWRLGWQKLRQFFSVEWANLMAVSRKPLPKPHLICKPIASGRHYYPKPKPAKDAKNQVNQRLILDPKNHRK
ncbi:MAG: stage II sporulation protein P [Clostridia bacterium]|nr:stage II sporulation protein P [Clostridia bacterium]